LGRSESRARKRGLDNIRLLVLVVVALIAFSPPSRADVPYLSGGIGVDERQELLDKEKDYHLKIVTAEASGDYVGDVRVVIESAGKGRVLETTMEGPILLARLGPGTTRSGLHWTGRH